MRIINQFTETSDPILEMGKVGLLGGCIQRKWEEGKGEQQYTSDLIEKEIKGRILGKEERGKYRRRSSTSKIPYGGLKKSQRTYH